MLYGASIMEAFNVNDEFNNVVEHFADSSKDSDLKVEPTEAPEVIPTLKENPTESPNTENKDEIMTTISIMEHNFNDNLSTINDRINNLLNTIEQQHKNNEIQRQQFQNDQLNQLQSVDLFGRNIHDILLFIIFGIFVILLLEGIFNLVKIKLGKK